MNIGLERADFLKIFVEHVLGKWDPYRDYLKRYGPSLFFKHELARMHKPEMIVEIGVRAGYSMWSMLVSCPEVKYTGYDLWAETPGVETESQEIQNMCQDHALHLALTLGDSSIGAGRFHIYKRDSQVTNFKPVAADLYHIDGAHGTGACYTDIVNCFNVMTDRAIINVHDHNSPDIRSAVNNAVQDLGLKRTVVSNEWGDALLTKGEPPAWFKPQLVHRWREWWDPYSLNLVNQVLLNVDMFTNAMEDPEPEPIMGGNNGVTDSEVE